MQTGGTGNAAVPKGGAAAQCPCKDAKITAEAVAKVPSNRARTKLGVGESTKLTFSLGAATWTQPGAGKLSGTSGATATYTAPDRAASDSITATGCGCSVTISLEVIEPTGVRMEQRTGTKGNHQKGKASVGFIATIFILPADVSFENCSYLEDEAYAVGTGCYEEYMKKNKVGHHPNASAIPIGPPQSDTSGSKVNGYDRIAASASACDGTFTMSIPWKFQVGSGASKVFTTIDQVVSTTKAGAADISKAGASNHSDLNDSNEKDPLF